MKEVLYHYVVMVKTLVPDQCPTDDYDKMVCWCQDNNVEPMDVETDTRDWEIVDVEENVDYEGK